MSRFLKTVMWCLFAWGVLAWAVIEAVELVVIA